MNENDDNKSLWRGWSRIWTILIPLWVAALIAVWFVIGEFLYTDSALDHIKTIANQIPAADIDITPASGSADH